MKQSELGFRSLLIILTVASLPWCGSIAAAEKAAKKPAYSTNATDLLHCQQQMNRIYGAIQEYQRQHGKLPMWLSDLMPDLIGDPDLLVCPFVRATGSSREWRQRFVTVPVFGDANSTYSYELCLEPAYRRSTNTCRDYKQRQMEVMGFNVPIVRCLAHRPVLNLACDGNVYQSPDHWEDAFVFRKEDAPFFHHIEWMASRSRDEVIQTLIQPRPAGLAPNLLDLSSRYNALLLHLSQMSAAGGILSTYPEGLCRIKGVNFDVRGMIHLKGENLPMSFPARIQGIEVGRSSPKIHFLHGTVFEVPDGTTTASFIVHLANGRRIEKPIVYGRDVKTRWVDAAKPEAGNAGAAWTSPPDRTGTASLALRLFVTSWDNPNPEVAISRIDLNSTMTASAPFVVAITLD